MRRIRIIYKVTNLINNKIYIGKDSNNKKNYFGCGKAIVTAIKKYGIKNFKKEIIDHAYSLKQINKKETHWIKFYNSNNPKIGYNRSLGGELEYCFKGINKEAIILSEKRWKIYVKSKKHVETMRVATTNYYKLKKNRIKQSKRIKKVWKNYSNKDLLRIKKNYSKAQKPFYIKVKINNKTYPSITYASKKLNIHMSVIRYRLDNKRFTKYIRL